MTFEKFFEGCSTSEIVSVCLFIAFLGLLLLVILILAISLLYEKVKARLTPKYKRLKEIKIDIESTMDSIGKRLYYLNDNYLSLTFDELLDLPDDTLREFCRASHVLEQDFVSFYTYMNDFKKTKERKK